MLARMIVFTVLGQASLSGSPQEPPAPKIVEIVVHGNKALNRQGILSATGLKVGDAATRKALDQAFRNLISTGNFGAHHPDEPEKAVVVRTDVDAANTARVIVEVDENDVVNGFNVTGAGPMKSQEVMMLVQTKPGMILNLNVLRTDIVNIQKLYAGNGYHAIVASEGLGMTKDILDIPIVVGKFSGYRFGDLPKRLLDALIKGVRLKPGSFFHLPTYERDLERIAKTCAQFGYVLEPVPQDFSRCTIGEIPSPDIKLSIKRLRPAERKLPERSTVPFWDPSSN